VVEIYYADEDGNKIQSIPIPTDENPDIEIQSFIVKKEIEKEVTNSVFNNYNIGSIIFVLLLLLAAFTVVVKLGMTRWFS